MGNTGLLIWVEGTDGSGKSTLCKSLEKKLNEEGKSTATYTREPGGSKLGSKIRDLLIDPDNEICPEAEFLLFAADRSQHYKEVVIPALETGKTVISDRSGISSLVYQGYGQGADKDKITQVNSWACHCQEPDLIIFLDLDLKTANARLMTSRGNLDRFEKLGPDFFARVEAGFKEQQEKAKSKIIINASQSPEQVLQEAMAAIEELKKCKTQNSQQQPSSKA